MPQGRPFSIISRFLHTDLRNEISTKLRNWATITHPATRHWPISVLEFEKQLWLAGNSLMLSSVCGYYEQTWTQMKKEDLAESCRILPLRFSIRYFVRSNQPCSSPTLSTASTRSWPRNGSGSEAGRRNSGGERTWLRIRLSLRSSTFQK